VAAYKLRAVLRAYAAIQVGQDLQSVRAFNSSNSKHNKPELVHFREIGGAMAAMWSAYFDRCSCLLYVIDAAAEPQQLAAACELLFQQLLHSGLNSKRVVVCLNKTDLCSSDAIERAVACLKLDEVLLWAGHSVQVVQASALTGNNVLAVLRAVQQQQQPAVAYSATKAAGCVPQTTAAKQQLQLPALVPKTQATCAAG
jgi:GTPase involved in cell partitioning and DNA repair